METPSTREQSTLNKQESSAESDQIQELTSVTERAAQTFREKAQNNTLR